MLIKQECQAKCIATGARTENKRAAKGANS